MFFPKFFLYNFFLNASKKYYITYELNRFVNFSILPNKHGNLIQIVDQLFDNPLL